MNRTTNLFVLLIAISFILPATAIRYAQAATENSQESSSTGNEEQQSNSTGSGQESGSSNAGSGQESGSSNAGSGRESGSSNTGNASNIGNARQAATPCSLTIGNEGTTTISGKLECGGQGLGHATIHLTLHHITTGRTTTATAVTEIPDGSYDHAVVLGAGHSYTADAKYDGDSAHQPAFATASINIPGSTGSTQQNNNAGNSQQNNNAGNATSTSAHANATSTGAAISLSGHITTSNNAEQSSTATSSSGFTQLFNTWHSPQKYRYELEQIYNIGYDAGYKADPGAVDSCEEWFNPTKIFSPNGEASGYCHKGFVAGQHDKETGKSH